MSYVKYDYHLHTSFSFDSETTVEKCLNAAREKGLEEICVTDHFEPGCPYVQKSGFDLTEYIEALRDKAEKADGISLKVGIEAALTPEVIDLVTQKLSGMDFDFIIASQHAVNGKDPWYGDYFGEWDIRQGQRLYLEEILKNIRVFDNFDVIGHIGYVDKYFDKYPQYKDPQPFTHADFPDLIDDILKNVIGRGKGIEVNTSNYYVHGYPTPHPSIIKRYAELGGEILTFGSDAHLPEAVGGFFSEATELVKDCGVKYVCTYTKRTPEFHKI